MNTDHDKGLITRDPAAWRRLWLEAKERSPVNRRVRSGQAEVALWNQRAAAYARHSESEQSLQRQEQILAWLQAAGALEPGWRVLDIGAGPGNFALPLAGVAAEVVAVEPAGQMVDILMRRARDEGIANISVVNKTWEEVDLQAAGWQQGFDLVFASMSPGISSPEALEKMNRASRAFCYLSGWSGGKWGRWGRAQAELWPLLFSERLQDYPGDILYPFGLLYALGYRPQLRFEHPEVNLEMPAEEAAEGLAEHFRRYTEISEEILDIIRTYVRRHSRRGVFQQRSRSCQGFMLWRVQREEDI